MTAAFNGRYASRDVAMFEFGLRTGFRTSEILSIRVGDVFRAGRMLPSVTVQRCWMKGGKRCRSMPLHQAAAKSLLKWILEAGFTKAEMADQPLFCRQLTNKRMTRVQAWAILKGAALRAGLDVARVASHSMRKTFASNMWQSEFVQGDMAKMARLLGHRNFSNTLRYLEFLDNSLECAVLAP
ncbi:N/A [soil metagenome]